MSPHMKDSSALTTQNTDPSKGGVIHPRRPSEFFHVAQSTRAHDESSGHGGILQVEGAATSD